MSRDLELLWLHPPGEHLGDSWTVSAAELEENLDGSRVVLGSRAVYLGRTRQCEIHLRESSVGRRHCSFRTREETWFVKHLGSTNGTRLYGHAGDARISREPIDCWERDAAIDNDNVLNPGSVYFHAFVGDAGEHRIRRERIRLRFVDWLTGALRAEAFFAGCEALPKRKIVIVEFSGGQLMDVREPWPGIAGELIRGAAGPTDTVGLIGSMRFGIATTQPDSVAARCETAFAEPWLQCPTATVRIEHGPIAPAGGAAMPPILAPPRCLACKEKLWR